MVENDNPKATGNTNIKPQFLKIFHKKKLIKKYFIG